MGREILGALEMKSGDNGLWTYQDEKRYLEDHRWNKEILETWLDTYHQRKFDFDHGYLAELRDDAYKYLKQIEVIKLQ